MNNTFNAKRFGWLFKKTLLERPSQMFGFTGLILAIILIVYFICKSLWNFSAAQNISFIWGLAGGGCFFASLMFSYFSSNANGSSYLTLPASQFEKWLCGILIAGVFYPIIFLLFFRAMDAGFVTLYHNSLDSNSPLYKIEYDRVYLLSFTGRLAVKVYSIFALFAGVAMIGSLYFNKVSFVKTALIFCAICFAVYGLNLLIAKLLFGNINDAFPFNYVTIAVGKTGGTIELPKSINNISNYITDYFLALLFFAIAYIRLREKEF